MMKVLVFGAGGMLGHKLVQIFSDKFDVFATLRTEFNNYEYLDILERKKTFNNVNVDDVKKVKETVEKVRPDVIVNAVGIIKQIQDAGNIIKTLTINSIFPHRLAEIAEEYNSRLICISTDCVFSGKKGNYSEEDVADSGDLYGKSKNLGEVTAQNCLTIRTSIIGKEIGTKHSLLEWFLSNQRETVKGYKNAVFSGFPTIILAEILADLIENHKTMKGLYHVSSEPINKFDLLSLIKKEYRANIEIEPDEDFVIDRSLNSTKFRAETGFTPQAWNKMINKMAEDPTNYAGRKK